MKLEVKGVYTHNLKGFDLKIPLNKLVIITGPSGSGKSSLAFDTIAKIGEINFRLLQNYGTPAEIGEKPQAMIYGSIPPILALSQGVQSWFPYKNVCEILGFSSFLKELFREKGKVRCPFCGTLNEFHSLKQILDWFQSLTSDTKFIVLLPILEASPQALRYLLSQGFTRYFIDGKEIDLSEEDPPSYFKEAFILLDRMVKTERALLRLIENLRNARAISRGQIVFRLLEGKTYRFNYGNNCYRCGRLLSLEFKKCPFCKGLGFKEKRLCEECKGLKLEKSCLGSQIFSKSLEEILTFTLKDLEGFLQENLSSEEKTLWKNVFNLLEKIRYLKLEDLKLSTPVFELSLGERKLLELLLLFSVNLRGVLYILDEPTLGLDKKRRKRVLALIKELRDQGNSFIIVEHDLNFLAEADYVIELGPEGGQKGGYLLKAISGKEYLEDPTTLYGQFKNRCFNFLRQELFTEDWIEINLGDITFSFLKKGINLLAGETSGIRDKFCKRLIESLKERGFKVVEGGEIFIEGSNKFLIEYLGIWDLWREVLISLPSSKALGLGKRHFSFYTKEGVCSNCQGKGYKVVKLDLFEVKEICEECLGKRINYEVLNLSYRGFKIYEILDWTLDEAIDIFSQNLPIKDILLLSKELGVSYLKLSQRLSELSGGERLRIEILQKLKGGTSIDFLFLFYPFQGLSFLDLKRLGKFFRKLNSYGITILMRETHPLADNLSDNIIEI